MKIERTKEPQKCSCENEATHLLTTCDNIKIYICTNCLISLSDAVFGEIMALYFESMKLRNN